MEHPADFLGEAVAVLVDVVDGGEVGGEFGGDAARK
jgi:hypothetical protein